MTESFVKNASVSHFSADIDIFACSECEMVQTRQNACDQTYYSGYAYTASTTKVASNWFGAVADLLMSKYGLMQKSLVLDAGSSDGGQLREFIRRGCFGFGFEPSAPLRNAALAQRIETSPQLFCKSALSEIPPGFLWADAVVSSFTFDHASDPRAFLNTAYHILNKRTGILALEVHDLDQIIRMNEWCLFQHEHTGYYTAKTLSDILRRCGFGVVAVNPLTNARGNSLFVIARPLESGSPLASIPDHPVDWYKANPNLMASRRKAKAWVKQAKSEGLKLAGYGAGARGVMTLATIADPGDFAYVVDDNPSYRGLLTPKSYTTIVGPEHPATERADKIVVFSYGYMNNIRNYLVHRLGYQDSQIIALPKIL